jgi:hypothetical protein
MSQKRVQVHKKISLRDFRNEIGGTKHEWMETPQAKELFETMKAHEINEQLCAKQAGRLSYEPERK